MILLTKEQFEKQSKHFEKDIREKPIVFIYPTDTIYGIGCNATNKQAVEKIRKIKQRPENPFSIIVPSKGWIEEFCVVNENARSWIKRLPGPYTLILPIKKQILAENVAPNRNAMGIRIPDHWFSDYAQIWNIPIVSTSANLSRKPFMTSLDDLEPSIKEQIDFIIYDGPKNSKPSKIIDLTDKEKVIER